jgi:hypothetical protein
MIRLFLGRKCADLGVEESVRRRFRAPKQALRLPEAPASEALRHSNLSQIPIKRQAK